MDNSNVGTKLTWLLSSLLMIVLALLVPAVLGLALIYQWAALTWRAEWRGPWRAAEGQVIDAHYHVAYTADEAITIDYHAEYEYVVNRIRYRSSRLSLEPFRDVELRELERAGLRLKRGAAVRVYYKPANPAEAILVPARPPHWSSLALGIAILGIPVFFTYYLWPSTNLRPRSL